MATGIGPDPVASGSQGYSPGDTAPPFPQAPPRRLRRVIAGKKIAGVCAGFAEYFDMDVTLVRLIWVGLLLLPPSPGLIIYIVAWIILPKS
jgi:phage shock protein PspC (stress-responsive transcriptional regulator)